MKAYGYCRYSSDLQTEASIEQQKSELLEYARKNNIDIINFYVDEAKSGTKDTRDSFQAMISDCKDKLVNCVLVWKTDRFARNTQDSLLYKMKLEKLGIKLISITQPIDTTTPEGDLMYTLLAGIDEYYSKNLASNVKRALKMNANNCKFNGGIAPLGYDIEDKQYVINLRESIIVQKIFNYYICGMSVIKIAEILNSQGFTTKKNKPFGKNSVYDIISNERYTGTYIYNKGTKSNHRIKSENEIRIENGIPAIISNEMYKQAMNIRKNNKRENFKKNSNVYILSGLIFCDKCGGKFTGSTSIKKKNGKEYRHGFYVCCNRNSLGKCNSTRIKQNNIESFVLKELKSKILGDKPVNQIIEDIKKEYNKFKSEAPEELKQLQQQLNKLKNESDNIVDIIAKTGNAKLVEKLDIITMQEEDIKSRIEFIKNNNINISNERIKEVFLADFSTLENGSKEELKKLARKYINKIIICEDSLLIDYSFSAFVDRKEFSQIDLVAKVRSVFHLRISYNINVLKDYN